MPARELISDEPFPVQKYYPVRLARAFILLVVSESRVLIFVWALTASYLIASGLRPQIYELILLLSSGYFLSLGVYILNALADLEEDKINSPSRPLASGAISKSDAKVLIVLLLASAFAIGFFISFATLALFVVTTFLGVTYSIPRIQAKKRFPHKMIVASCGSAVFSLAGGAAAQNLNSTIFFAAVSFALFAMVTLLLGDIADFRGDSTAGVRSLPIVIGPEKAVWIAALFPLVLCTFGLVLFRSVNLNVIFPIVLISISSYSALTIGDLLHKYNDASAIRRVKTRMRLVHFALQLSFILGLLTI